VKAQRDTPVAVMELAIVELAAVKPAFADRH
jgi:hypothetical protein